MYSSPVGFRQGLNGLYAQARMERNGWSSNTPLVAYSFAGTDIIMGTHFNIELNRFGPEIMSNNPEIEYIWIWLYQVINSANTIIIRSENPTVEWSDAEKRQVQGEARFFRAWAYRHLVYLWGDVPRNLDEAIGSSVKTDWARTPMADVCKQMEDDFKFSMDNISGDPNETASNITSWIAKCYLAELYMELGNNATAVSLFQDIIDNGPYKLLTARYGVRINSPGDIISDMFLDGNTNRNEGNTEVMWSLQTEYNVAGGDYLWNRRMFGNRYDRIRVTGTDGESVTPFQVTVARGGRGTGRIGPTVFMMQLYKSAKNAGSLNDDRGSYHNWKLFYIFDEASGDVLPTGFSYGDTIFTNTDQYIYKDAQFTHSRKHDEAIPDNVRAHQGYKDWPYLRLAEVYLLLAEAQYKEGSNADAVTTINILRARANADPITEADLNIDFILDEQARELFGEDHRKYHLLRNNKWLERTLLHNDAVNDKNPDGWNSIGPTTRDLLLPIPQSVIDANLDLELQLNTGYYCIRLKYLIHCKNYPPKDLGDWRMVFLLRP